MWALRPLPARPRLPADPAALDGRSPRGFPHHCFTTTQEDQLNSGTPHRFLGFKTAHPDRHGKKEEDHEIGKQLPAECRKSSPESPQERGLCSPRGTHTKSPRGLKGPVVPGPRSGPLACTCSLGFGTQASELPGLWL